MNRALTLVAVAMTMMGCAANVDEDVEQIADPAPQREAPATTFSGDLRGAINDPIMQALIDDNQSGVGALPPKQLAVQIPGR
jgi:hypothetical protein